MEWKDLTKESKNILELCWGLYDDNPRKHIATTSSKIIEEIKQYHQTHTEFDYEVDGDKITVWGNCQFGSWLK
jgi:hypothetical protein